MATIEEYKAQVAQITRQQHAQNITSGLSQMITATSNILPPPGTMFATVDYSSSSIYQDASGKTGKYLSPLHGPTNDPYEYFIDVVMHETDGNKEFARITANDYQSEIGNRPDEVLSYLRGRGYMDQARADMQKKKVPAVMTPPAIKKELDRWVIGQDGAKKALAVAAYNHYERVAHNLKQTDKKAMRMSKSNVVLVGPTGSGKTLLVQTLAKILSKPIVITDATDLTPEGYVGSSAEDCLLDLFVAAGEDKAKAETGIVFIDEIDKLAYGAMSPGSGPIKGLGSQQSLLKFVEGKEKKGTQANPFSQGTPDVKTENILFIIGGAFSGVTQKEGWDGTMSHQDLIDYGLMPEFVGRFPVISILKPLTQEMMLDILMATEDCLVKQYKALFNTFGTKLFFTTDSLKYLAAKSVKNNTGARGARAMIETKMLDLMFEGPEKKWPSLTVTKSFLKGIAEPVYADNISEEGVLI